MRVLDEIYKFDQSDLAMPNAYPIIVYSPFKSDDNHNRGKYVFGMVCKNPLSDQRSQRCTSLGVVPRDVRVVHPS